MKIKIKDKDYEVSPFTQHIQQIYTERIANFHLDLIRENKNLIKNNEYLDLLKQHFFDAKSGVYDFGGEIFFKFLNMKNEFAFFFWWLIMEKDQMINLEEVKEWIKNNFDEAKLIFEKFQEELDDQSRPEDKKKEDLD